MKVLFTRDCWKANERLVDYGAKEHFRVKHSKSKFANSKFHINAIENFGVMQSIG